jgi:hypothetical protein
MSDQETSVKENGSVVQTSGDGEMLTVPSCSASFFNITTQPTIVSLLVSSMAMGVTPSGELVTGNKPEFLLSMSPQATKELSILLVQAVATYEAKYGTVTTPFVKERERAS